MKRILFLLFIFLNSSSLYGSISYCTITFTDYPSKNADTWNGRNPERYGLNYETNKYAKVIYRNIRNWPATVCYGPRMSAPYNSNDEPLAPDGDGGYFPIPNNNGTCYPIFESNGKVYTCDPNDNKVTERPDLEYIPQEDGKKGYGCSDKTKGVETGTYLGDTYSYPTYKCVPKSNDGETETGSEDGGETGNNDGNDGDNDGNDGDNEDDNYIPGVDDDYSGTNPWENDGGSTGGGSTGGNDGGSTGGNDGGSTGGTGGGSNGGNDGGSTGGNDGGSTGGNDGGSTGGGNSDNKTDEPKQDGEDGNLKCNDLTKLTLQQKLLCEMNAGIKKLNSEGKPSNSLNQLMKDLNIKGTNQVEVLDKINKNNFELNSKVDTTNTNLSNLNHESKETNKKLDSLNTSINSLNSTLGKIETNTSKIGSTGGTSTIPGNGGDGESGTGGNGDGNDIFSLWESVGATNTGFEGEADGFLDSLDGFIKIFRDFKDNIDNSIKQVNDLVSTAKENIQEPTNIFINQDIINCPTTYKIDFNSEFLDTKDITIDLCEFSSKIKPITYFFTFVILIVGLIALSFRILGVLI
ncbi:hypothetical protein [Arcobacter porcinus]|uniref:hypothetical protein n=1 Tax=Arcobacter porcinus TaxID=1935204 RepID=UPI0008259C04|nr:hypothetical protein [Arcobacter porcinus]OCL86635.1 hypothetical protein AAX30_01360 [Arcobacter porcinus]